MNIMFGWLFQKIWNVQEIRENPKTENVKMVIERKTTCPNDLIWGLP